MIDLKFLSSSRLKQFKKSLYRKRGAFANKCECCNEHNVWDKESYDRVTREISAVSKEQEMRNER